MIRQHKSLKRENTSCGHVVYMIASFLKGLEKKLVWQIILED